VTTDQNATVSRGPAGGQSLAAARYASSPAILLKACGALCLVAFGNVCQAQDHPNSLWIGGDPFIGVGPVENTDRAGNVFRSIPGTANGIGGLISGRRSVVHAFAAPA